MKPALFIRFCCIILFILTIENAYAADWFVGVEIPWTYNFASADDGSTLEVDGMPTGFMLSAQMVEFNAGVILESYKVPIEDGKNSSIGRTVIDLFYVLPIPYVQIGLGLGYGLSEVKGKYADSYEKSTASQALARFGYVFNEFVEINLSYRYIWSHLKIKNSDDLLETGGHMLSFGAGIGF